MPRIQSLAPVLRSFAAPRAVACHQQCRFATAPRRFAQKPPDASKTPSLPPNATSEAPQTPKEAQRAADLAAAEAVTESDSAQPPEPKPPLPSTHSDSPKNPSNAAPPTSPARTPSEPGSSTTKTVSGMPPGSPLPPPRYRISRTKSGRLPVYTDYKRGGNLHLTTIRKITGDVLALRDELRNALRKKDEHVYVNTLTQQVIVHGHLLEEVEDFLKERGM
ncbi:hypothetical protein NX059_003286 [Plenodomus lindquistii]|nr:hypothetical protein NX059_003286 [Plenodomus lindquistii]